MKLSAFYLISMYNVLGVMLVETAWLSFAVFWLVVNYKTCPVEGVKEAILGNLLLLTLIK